MLFLFLLLPLFSFASDVEPIKVGYIVSPPLVYHRHDDQLTGLAYELVHNILKDAEAYQVEYTAYTDIKTATQALQDGVIHIFLGSINYQSSSHTTATLPYFIDEVITLRPLPTFFERLRTSVNWTSLLGLSFLTLIIVTSFCSCILIFFDTPHTRDFRNRPLHYLFTHHFYSLFSCFGRNNLATPVSSMGRIITTAWMVSVILFLVSFTAVTTTSILSTMLPSPARELPLDAVAGKKIGFLDNAFGSAPALLTTSTLVPFANVASLVEAVQKEQVDYAVVSSSYLAYQDSQQSTWHRSELWTASLTYNLQTLSLNRAFAEKIVFPDSQTTYQKHFDDAITANRRSLKVYQLCQHFLKKPSFCLF